jgi:hypothetical protein
MDTELLVIIILAVVIAAFGVLRLVAPKTKTTVDDKIVSVGDLVEPTLQEQLELRLEKREDAKAEKAAK